MVSTAEPGTDVVGVQHRVPRGFGQTRAAEPEDVCNGAHEDTEVAVERMRPADALGSVLAPRELLAASHQAGDREVRTQRRAHRDGPGTRSASAVWGREGLVEVEVHDVDSHVAGPRDPQDRVQVGPVHVYDTDATGT